MSVKERQIPMMAGMMGPPKPLSKVMFEKFDKDGSGTIDVDEFKALVYDLGYFLSPAELYMAVQTIGGRSINYDKFKTWWGSSNRFANLSLDDEALELRRQASETFQKFDKDGNGTIDMAEWPEMYAEIRASGLTELDEATCLADLDQSRDGRIQFNEFIDWLIRVGSSRLRTFIAVTGASGRAVE